MPVGHIYINALEVQSDEFSDFVAWFVAFSMRMLCSILLLNVLISDFSIMSSMQYFTLSSKTEFFAEPAAVSNSATFFARQESTYWSDFTLME